jgi:DNA primase
MGNFIPERLLEEIRFRNDIVEVVGAHITLKRAGTTYKACCPFHKEKTPSFNVNPNLQIFKCFGCGEGGDVISFLMKHQGLDFVTAAKVLAERAGIALELEEDSGASKHRKLIYEINHAISQFYRRCLLQAPAGKAVREYLADRKLDGDIADTFQIGYAPDGWDIALQWGKKYKYTPDQLESAGLVLRSSREGANGKFYDRFRNRLMFPILDSQGRVIGFSGRILVKDDKSPKYVNSPETDVFHKGRVLYGMDKARRHIVNAPNREAVICEGQIDVVRCHQAGIETAVAAQGTAFTEEHVRALKNYADSVVLAFDSDSAGKAASVKAAVVFMDAGIVVRVAELPDGEDPDSFVKANGGKAFRDLLEGAQSAVAFRLSH